MQFIFSLLSKKSFVLYFKAFGVKVLRKRCFILTFLPALLLP